MPTLYTLLRAQHRHTVSPSEAVVPRVPKKYRPHHGKPLLAAEQDRRIKGIAKRAPRTRVKRKRKIIIVGGGLAGLCAAYELHGLKYDVEVYEARAAVGGRVHSDRHFIEGKVVERGGELIGSNHPLWNSYKNQFGLEFTDTQDYGNSPVRIGGRTLTFEQSAKLTDRFEKLMKALSELAETIVDPFEPWTNRDAQKLDALSLADWVNKTKATKQGKAAIMESLATDNGIPADQQSLLGVLAMVKGGGLDRYWTDSELFRCHGGNDQLAKKFEAALNKGGRRVFTNARVKTISSRKKKAFLEIVDRDGKKLHRTPRGADDVILAIPPSVWSTIVFKDRGAAALVKDAPGIGKNVKYLMRFKDRFWQKFASSPALSEDGPVNLTWETTEAEKKGDFAMVVFSGADDAQTCSAWREKERRSNYVKEMATPYPGIGGEIQKSEFVNWPEDKLSKGSYYFPRVNEVTRWGPIWKTGYGGWLHFAGEHTCYAFVGYMEGALNSGYRIARRIAVRDGFFRA